MGEIRNSHLAMRIKSIIMEEYRSEIEGKPKAELEFFVRDNVVQKAYPQDEFVLANGELILNRPNDGMTKNTRRVFFTLIENMLHKYRKIDYAHIRICYELNETRDNFEKMSIKITNEKHYKY